jgi:phage-related protein
VWELYRVDFKTGNNIDLGLTTLSVGRRQRAQEQLIVNPIPYSDTEAIEHTGKYLPYERSMEFFVQDDEQITLINNWLYGYGRLRTDKDPGGYFKAHVTSGLGYEKYLQVKDKMTVTFKINPPFFYLDSGDTPLVLTTPGSITNPGTHDAEPLIKITGSGIVQLDINGEVYQVTILDGYIMIDCESQYVYKDTDNLGDNFISDEFPVLTPGVNNISWTGTVTEIDIIPRWREK